MFWKRPSPEPEPSPSEPRPSLEPVRIFTPDAIINGWVEAGGQRLSDILSAEDLLSVAKVADPTASDWLVVERDRMLLVVPPPRTSDRALRPHRVKRPILVLSGHYAVRGRVHMIAGIALDPFLARSERHFLPVTEAWITSSERREVNEQHPALLVNVRSTAQRLQLKVVE